MWQYMWLVEFNHLINEFLNCLFMINDISICKFYENLIDAIDLGNFFRNFFMRKEKKQFFFTAFYISNRSGVKIYLQWFINNCFKGTH